MRQGIYQIIQPASPYQREAYKRNSHHMRMARVWIRAAKRKCRRKRPVYRGHGRLTITQKRSYKTHVALVHEQDTRFKCDLCEKGFPYRSMLERHKGSHTPVSVNHSHQNQPLIPPPLCNRNHDRSLHHLDPRNPSLSSSQATITMPISPKSWNVHLQTASSSLQTRIY